LAHVAPNGVFVAKDEGTPIGIAIPHALEDEWFLSEIYVEPSFQKRGVGWQLLTEAAKEAGVSAGVAVESLRVTFSWPGTDGGRTSSQRARTAPPKRPKSAIRKTPREGAERNGSMQAPQKLAPWCGQ